MPFVVMPYTMRWVIGEDDYTYHTLFTMCATVRLLAQIFGVFFVWVPLAQKKAVGKTRAFFIGNFCLAIVHCSLVLFLEYRLELSMLLGAMVVWGIAHSVSCLLNDILNEV